MQVGVLIINRLVLSKLTAWTTVDNYDGSYSLLYNEIYIFDVKPTITSCSLATRTGGSVTFVLNHQVTE